MGVTVFLGLGFESLTGVSGIVVVGFAGDADAAALEASLLAGVVFGNS